LLCLLLERWAFIGLSSWSTLVYVSGYLVVGSVALGLSSLVSSVAKLVAVLRAKDITINVRSWWR